MSLENWFICKKKCFDLRFKSVSKVWIINAWCIMQDTTKDIKEGEQYFEF